MRFSKSILGLSMFAGLMMASGAALAEPTTTIDGVTIPVGAFYADTEFSYEQLATTPGQSFGGVFYVSGISGSTPGNTYSYGQNGTYLYGVFDNFKVRTVDNSTQQVYLTGGEINYYVSHGTSPFTYNSGTTAGDFAADKTGTLWLSANPEVLDASNDTLILSITSGTVNSFAGARAQAFLDVTGGEAFYNFNTNTVLNGGTGVLGADIDYQGTANSAPNPSDFPVSGTNQAKATTVPEPITLSLFGAGLFGTAALRRRKKKQA